MKYLNLSATINQHNDLLRSTPEQKGVWFDLICYCHQQMNSGMIQGCADWTDTMWQRIAGVPASFVAQETHLWHWAPTGMLIVHHYDASAEETYRRKQMLGKRFAEQRWAAINQRKIIRISSGDSGKPQKDNAS